MAAFLKAKTDDVLSSEVIHVLGSKIMLAEYDKHYPTSSGQTSLARAVTKITKPVTKNNFGPST